MKKKRASYKAAVEWIASEDAPGDSDAFDPEAISDNLTVCLVADVFHKDRYGVALDVVFLRSLWRDRGEL